MVALFPSPLRMPQRTGLARHRTSRHTPPRVEARRLDHAIFARRLPRLTLRVENLSHGGLSASSDVPLTVGEHVSVTFPPQPGQPVWEAYGRVVDCEPAGDAYHVEVEFHPLPAA